MIASFRKVRRFTLSYVLWRKRLVFWIGAGLIGASASYYAMAADRMQRLFHDWVEIYPALPLLLSPLVFALVAWLTQRFSPGARGSGIPQAIAARILRDKESRHYLLGPQIILTKVAFTLLGLLGGASIGREGPTVQVGACILLLCATVGRIASQRGIVLAGAAAGVAAAFNTPLAGIVFAIEEMARAFEHRNSTIVMVAIVFAGAAAMSILGNYSYFGYADAQLTLGHDWLSVLVIGLIGGLFGSLFARLMVDGDRWLRTRWSFFKKQPVVFAGLCGLGVALIGIATHGITYGSGYGLANDLIHGQTEIHWWQMPAKFLATWFSAISGIPGGIFSPSLSVGAALGAELSSLFPATPEQAIVILAMVAYFAAVTQAPITAFVIVLEITGRGSAAVPLIATGIIAAGVSRVLCPVSLYHILAKQFVTEARVKEIRPASAIS